MTNFIEIAIKDPHKKIILMELNKIISIEQIIEKVNGKKKL